MGGRGERGPAGGGFRREIGGSLRSIQPARQCGGRAVLGPHGSEVATGQTWAGSAGEPPAGELARGRACHTRADIGGEESFRPSWSPAQRAAQPGGDRVGGGDGTAA